jgi:hypothetical protein
MHECLRLVEYEGVRIRPQLDLLPDVGIGSVVGKRGLFLCRIARLFVLKGLKESMSGDARDFNNIETRAIKFFPCKERHRRKFTSF